MTHHSWPEYIDTIATVTIGMFGSLSLTQAHDILRVAITFCTLGYVATKWYRLLYKTVHKVTVTETVTEIPTKK